MTMNGPKLCKNLVAATGLPTVPVENELARLLGEAGLDPSRVTLEELREMMANYLQDIMLSINELGLLDYNSEVGA